VTKDAAPFSLGVRLTVRSQEALLESTAVDFVTLLSGTAPTADQAEENYG
jgi:hypothetical protein